MSDSKTNHKENKRTIDLDVSGHLMSLNAGLYCIYHSPGQAEADEFGFPGLRVSLPPFQQKAHIKIETFEKDGWLGAEKNAALVRVSNSPGLILITIYENPARKVNAPNIQVTRLNDAPKEQNRAQLNASTQDETPPRQEQNVSENANGLSKKEEESYLFAHVERMGDVTVALGDWVGVPDSKTWIEGFSLHLGELIDPEDIEYQAVLGKGWMSPWYKGKQFCGSRGMALPLCGLRVRLSDEASKKITVRLSATFVDGSKVGPVEDDTIVCADSIAPLEAIRVELIQRDNQENNDQATSPSDPVVNRVVRSNIKLKTPVTKANVEN
ncbi:hypothetical protein COMNV_01784 [Commensalibacter sp. Nvir]|uniref:hypothetical protein n=1 Tax=Commensalibacter sp. Nvir TaxID=3069817 RepID=UPI002D244D49|nr:hypothetical protein COMNV_01784 [Commensalibacter sp. Nvir]